ncbi:hypothetical protein BV25DRAFT_1867060 [Artomyces pyxidatus]|uniref:Uncharacterized protein n=1 Tax=Artomyces pyxidatus TaxID=48021 RepID=A0ACB8TLE6_9AGAM|nr:hypothetical protein BV25DRAFT_1867060 [Artomyces pyxidatus]
MSIFCLMNWMWSGSSSKSITELDRLVHEVLLAPDFRTEDLEGFDAKRETDRLDKALGSEKENSLPIAPEDGWREPPIPIFSVPGLHHRSLIATIKATWADASATQFHFSPFRQFWRNGDKVERVRDEIYSSEAFVQADEEVRNLPPEPGCTLERTVCAMMFWSDSTHLTNFGTAALWPLYLFFGNQSKYTRANPRSGACHHVAYIPKLPDSFFDFFLSITGMPPTDEVVTHCRRELMHAVLRMMLDDEFIHAYQHGIVIKCADGITRRVYPRIFTYSADYPEKVLLATIRNLGACPCPRCTIPKADIPELGMLRDESRRVKHARTDDETFQRKAALASDAVYRLGKGVKSVPVERLVSPESYVPTENAFSQRLHPFKFDFFPMLVVDLMHEFELGVWKAVFTHLIRILVAYGGDAVQILNRRYRQVPTFGRATIRRFSDNASAMKKLAARNYEDLLQCALPVFEGLLPEPHNKTILDLLFGLAEWHALAKLRMHTDSSLSLLSKATIYLGSQLRRFAKYTCSAFNTKELPRETAARGRRKQKSKPAGNPHSSGPAKTLSTPKKKLFNLLTYKLHALGDYVRQIMWFGTSDSYSTQPGELEHRRVKRYYARTNKNNAVHQITLLQRREEGLRRMMRGKTITRKPLRRSSRRKAAVGFDQAEPLPFTPPENHHHISHSRKHPLQLSNWLAESAEDPATKDFMPRLQDHILERLRHPDMASEGRTYSAEDRAQVIIQNNRIFRHKVFRVNYTTYDVRRAQDSMNPRTHADVITLLRDEDGVSLRYPHPFSYARILGVFHVDFLYNVPGLPPIPKSIEFLWVRWFRHDAQWASGFLKRRLHRIHLLPDTDDNAFGFLDPDDVIRGSHLIPAFAHEKVDDEWKFHYVNFFVDRDMYMRYRGIGVGHSYRACSESAPQYDATIDLTDDSELNDTIDFDCDAVNRDATEEEIAEEQGSEEESEEEIDPEEDLGPEDGEGGANEDEDEEGYAAL